MASVDYRKLNAITKKDAYPLPRIEELLDAIGNTQWFSSLDLFAGFHEVPLALDSREKTAFITRNGQYEYLRMPFGLCNAPSTFQRMMNDILAEVVGKFVTVYVDDVFIFSRSFEEHHLSD